MKSQVLELKKQENLVFSCFSVIFGIQGGATCKEITGALLTFLQDPEERKHKTVTQQDDDPNVFQKG